jgi:hypothetical protein
MWAERLASAAARPQEAYTSRHWRTTAITSSMTERRVMCLEPEAFRMAHQIAEACGATAAPHGERKIAPLDAHSYGSGSEISTPLGPGVSEPDAARPKDEASMWWRSMRS